MSERKINRIMKIVKDIEEICSYENDYADTMDFINDAYSDYKEVLSYN